MDDLISRKSAIDIAMQYCPDDDGSCSKAWADIREMLDELEDLPSAQPEQRWIPVTERLPKVDNISKRVLVTTSWGVVKEAYYCVDHWSIDDVDYKFSVAAWMPLPEPWKGEEK